MRISDYVKKMFIDGQWYVAYKTNNSDAFSLAEIPEDQWCADPFVYKTKDKHYIFVEQYLKKKLKGCIGYFEIENGIPVNKGIIIENNYHMSYPDVFEYAGQFYMIPESSANKTVDLYIAEVFPNKWRKVKTLISGKKYVDSTVYQEGNNFYVFSYCIDERYEVHVFALDMDKQELTLLSKKRYEENVGRPGGRLFKEEGNLMRPAQDCSRKYGEALIIYQIDELNHNGEMIEHEVKRMRASELKVSKDPERLHHYTTDGKYEVIDVYKEKIDLLHAPKIYLRSMRK